MSFEHQDQIVVTGRNGGLMRKVLLGAAIVYVLGSLYFIIHARSRIVKLEAAQTAAKAESAQLLKRLGVAESSVKAESEVLAERVGVTQKDIAARAAALQRQQREAEERLTEQTKQQVGAISGEVAGVKTEVGGSLP